MENHWNGGRKWKKVIKQKYLENRKRKYILIFIEKSCFIACTCVCVLQNRTASSCYLAYIFSFMESIIVCIGDGIPLDYFQLPQTVFLDNI